MFSFFQLMGERISENDKKWLILQENRVPSRNQKVKSSRSSKEELPKEFKWGATLCNGYDPCISYTYTPTRKQKISYEINKEISCYLNTSLEGWEFQLPSQIERDKVMTLGYTVKSFICEILKIKHCQLGSVFSSAKAIESCILVSLRSYLRTT